MTVTTLYRRFSWSYYSLHTKARIILSWFRGEWIYWPLIHTTRTISNYCATANLHNSQITTAHAKHFLAWQWLLTVVILQLHTLRFYLHSLLCRILSQLTGSSSKSHCNWRSVSLSVCLGVKHRLGLMTRCFFLFESYCPVHVGRPLWREVGSVICQSQSVVLVRHLYNYLQFYC
jgi:hypothetical protein